jgi:LysM domain
VNLDWQSEVRRYATPFVLLLLVTAAALLVRGGLRDDEPRQEAKPTVARHAAPRPVVKRAAEKFYLVEYGETLGDIADRFGTSVDRLLELNPAVDPRSLRVGQRVRVG